MENTTIKKPVNQTITDVLNLMKDPNKYVVVQVAPACRVALGELFNMQVGTVVTSKMVESLKLLGFKAVFDTNFGADVTIMEESAEFYERVKNNGPFPQFTSCCIGWLNMASRMYKDVVMPLISTTKSPIGCLGSIIKNFYAKKVNVKREDMVVVSIVPCVLKALENKLPYNKTDGIDDVDYCLTTKDLGVMIENANIDFANLKGQEFDSPLGEASGGGIIFGRSGGVMEAAIRNAIYMEKGEIFNQSIEFKSSSISSDIMESEITLLGKQIKICHCGMVGVKAIVELIKTNNCPYHFIEVMACPGGCIMGAGQPMHLPKEILPNQVKQMRCAGLNNLDENASYRVSSLNKSVMKVYEEIYDNKVFGEKAENALHRKY